MPEFDLSLVDAVDALKNCGFIGDEAAVQAEAESLLRNRNGLLFETSTGSHCEETDSNDSYDTLDDLNLEAMIVRQNSAALNCGLSDHEAPVEAESLLRNRNVRLYDSGGRSDNDLNETDSEDSYDVLDHIDLGAMNRKDELQQDYEKDETLKVRHRQAIEKS